MAPTRQPPLSEQEPRQARLPLCEERDRVVAELEVRLIDEAGRLGVADFDPRVSAEGRVRSLGEPFVSPR